MKRFIALALLALTGVAVAQTYPSRPVRLIVPFPAGSTPDIVGRTLGQKLADAWGQPVVVENIAGNSGAIGTDRVAKAAPDGYTFVFGNTGTHAHNQTLYKRPCYDSTTDFEPIGLIADLPTLLIARRDFPAENLIEFVAYAKANGAKMQYGSAGGGSTTHLACALLNAAVGIDIAHIPYCGGAPAIQDLLAGRLDYQCITARTAAPLIESKQLKAIVNLTAKRSSLLPELATAHEQGVKDFAAEFWTGFFLPKGTPKDIVQRLNAATVVAMNAPSV